MILEPWRIFIFEQDSCWNDEWEEMRLTNWKLVFSKSAAWKVAEKKNVVWITGETEGYWTVRAT